MSMYIDLDDPDDSDLRTLAAEQRRELMESRTLESDLDFAFQLQLQEAVNASLSLQPSSSTSTSALLDKAKPPPSPKSSDDVSRNFNEIQSEELLKFEQEMGDRLLSEMELKKMRDDLHRLFHDQKLAKEINDMPDDEWEEIGDNYERPFGKGSSESVNSEIFRVYCKGLVDKGTAVMNYKTNNKGLFGDGVLSAIGVAICDSRDKLLFEVKKTMSRNGISRQSAELNAIIEGLNAAVALQLERVVFFCDYYPIYQFVTGRWKPKQRKVLALVSQVILLQRKFAYCRASFVARNEIKFAFELAREAIVSQMNRPTGSNGSRGSYETCAICLEDADVNQIFSVDGCTHRYCFSCMRQHVEVKLREGMIPKCPHEGCESELKIDSSSKYLSPKFVEIMKQRMKEASIPVTEKVYCPYPKCSALMSKSEVLEYSKKAFIGAEITGARKCPECKDNFCINCKVPWHTDMTCFDYKRRYPKSPADDVKLKSLAARNLWRQCVKCNHMIELAEGCYHMTCRCGYEFCYTCGAEYKEKKATCSCPLWDEEYILDEEFDEDDEFSDEEDSEYDSDDYL